MRQGGIPDLPAGLVRRVARCARPAARRSPATSSSPRAADGDRLDVGVVDVSGKGEEAGTRALLLSGAFGGLLGALPPEDFLPAANDYLLRQDWDEGFATAVHLSLDLDDRRLRGLRPPATRRPSSCAAGSGRWSVHETEGPVLGLIAGRRLHRRRGRHAAAATRCCSTPTAWSRRRSRDISLGIDRLLGAGRAAAARQTSRAAPTGSSTRLGSRNDDRALLLVHRR